MIQLTCLGASAQAQGPFFPTRLSAASSPQPAISSFLPPLLACDAGLYFSGGGWGRASAEAAGGAESALRKGGWRSALGTSGDLKRDKQRAWYSHWSSFSFGGGCGRFSAKKAKPRSLSGRVGATPPRGVAQNLRQPTAYRWDPGPRWGGAGQAPGSPCAQSRAPPLQRGEPPSPGLAAAGAASRGRRLRSPRERALRRGAARAVLRASPVGLAASRGGNPARRLGTPTRPGRATRRSGFVRNYKIHTCCCRKSGAEKHKEGNTWAEPLLPRENLG